MFEQIFFHTQSLDGEINTFVTKKKKMLNQLSIG